jgi:dihydroxyacetone kinase
MATEVSAASMRKLLNDPADVVKESLAGLAVAHARILRYDAGAQILTRADAPVAGKVALISGGGSGHEPLHGGFVGKGMLDAPVRSSRRRCPSRCSPRPRRSTAAPESSTSSRTTPAT